MKENHKNNNEKLTSGASAVGGFAVGAAIGAMAAPTEAQAAEAETPEVEPEAVEVVEVVTTEVAPESEPGNEPKMEPTPEPAPETNPETQPEPSPTPDVENPVIHMDLFGESDVEVIGYERQTLENGEKMDLAVVQVNGQEVGLIDLDLDGQADLLMSDFDQNGQIDDHETLNIQGQGVSMVPIQEAVDFNPLLSQNDLPDYVNNADVDTYMA